MALVLLELKPVEFWQLTPAETADLVIAFRERENRRAIQRAWEIFHLLGPYVPEHSELTPTTLFKAMPMAFPDDMAEADLTANADDDQRAALTRRRQNRKRVNRPQ